MSKLTSAASRVGISFGESGVRSSNIKKEHAFFRAVEQTENTCTKLRDLRANFDREEGPTPAQSAEERTMEDFILREWASQLDTDIDGLGDVYLEF